MEFDRDRVYGAVNADELRAGDKVIVGDSLRFLRQEVEGDGYIETLKEVLDESHLQRFKAKDGVEWGLAYLVERKENCTNCEGCGEGVDPSDARTKIMGCSQWKPQNKEENMNNWNYNELPEKQEMGVSDRVVVAIKGYNTVDVGYYDFDLQAWFVMDNRYPVPVYAWQAIKPPREA